MGYRQLLYCAFEGRTHSPVRWTHFPLSNGTRGVRNGVNLTDWEFQSETFLLNALTGWILNEQLTLTKHSFTLPLLFTACPSLSVSIPSLLDLCLLLFLSFPLQACFVPFSFLSHWQVTKVQLLTRIAKKKKNCKSNWPFNTFSCRGLVKHYTCFYLMRSPHDWPPCRSKSVQCRNSSLAFRRSFNNTFLLHLMIAAAHELSCHHRICAGCFSPLKGSVYLSAIISPLPLLSKTVVTLTTFTCVTCEYWM